MIARRIIELTPLNAICLPAQCRVHETTARCSQVSSRFNLRLVISRFVEKSRAPQRQWQVFLKRNRHERLRIRGGRPAP
jgi:hypothetical protein